MSFPGVVTLTFLMGLPGKLVARYLAGGRGTAAAARGRQADRRVRARVGGITGILTRAVSETRRAELYCTKVLGIAVF